MSDIDGEPRGRSATGAVVIAVIFLAILGTGVGIVLGTAEKNRAREEAGDSPTPATASAGSAAPSTSRGSRTPRPGTSTSYKPTTKTACPDQTEEAADRQLDVTLYIRTGRAEVWICTGGGRTVYQGHILNTAFTADTSLYIGTVRYEAGVWAATNGDTTYFVSRDRLRQEKNGVEQVDEAVLESYEP